MIPLAAFLGLVLVPVAACADDAAPTRLIGYTEGRNDLPGGQFVNWVTNRGGMWVGWGSRHPHPISEEPWEPASGLRTPGRVR